MNLLIVLKRSFRLSLLHLQLKFTCYLQYILFFKIFNSKNIEITVFIVSLTTILFQQFLPKSFERVVLSEDNTKLKLDKKYGEKIAIDFKIFNYVGMIIILSMLIIKFAHLVLKGILNY